MGRPRKTDGKVQRCEDVYRRLEADMGRPPTPAEVAAATGFPPRRVSNLLRYLRVKGRLDPYQPGAASPPCERLTDEQRGAMDCDVVRMAGLLVRKGAPYLKGADRDDAVGDVLLHMVRKIHKCSLGPGSTPAGFLWAVGEARVRDLVRGAVRRHRTRPRFHQTHDDLMEEVAAVSDDQTDDDITAALDSLPDEHRTMVRLYFWHGVGIDQMARELGRPQWAVRKELTKALRILRERLEATRAPL